MTREIANATCIGIRACGLPKSVSYSVINEITKWLKCSGAEWTVSRLKELKLLYIRKLAGQEYKPSWIALHSNNVPKGPLGAIFKCKKPQKVLAALMVYTGYKAKKVTPKQFAKFHNSANRRDIPGISNGDRETPYFTYSELKFLTDIATKRCISNNEAPQRKQHFVSLLDFCEKNVRIPTLDTTGTALKTEPLSLPGLVNTMAHPLFQGWFAGRRDTPEEYLEAIASCPYLGARIDFNDQQHNAVGRVAFIQEGGYKLRAIFNPLPCFQVALSDMGDHLYKYLKYRVPEDCTFDQLKGIEDVAKALNEGVKLATLDLSDATNSFPLEVTMHILRNHKDLDIDPHDLDLFEAISRGYWNYPDNPEEHKNVRLNWGQPLGLYPSFAAFAVSHHVVVRAVLPKFYRILGDDIVIDAEAAERLKKRYELLRVNLSEAKCFESTQLAEFAGKIIYQEKILVQPKHHALNDRNFVDVLKVLPGFEAFLTWKQRKVVKTLKRIHKNDSNFGLTHRYEDNDYTPLIQSYLVSLGYAHMLKGEAQNLMLASPTAEKLKKLKLRIHLKHIREVQPNKVWKHVELEDDADETTYESGSSSTEARVLESAGVTHVESDHELPGWVSKSEIPQGDPRPVVTVKILSQKLKYSSVDGELDSVMVEALKKLGVDPNKEKDFSGLIALKYAFQLESMGLQGDLGISPTGITSNTTIDEMVERGVTLLPNGNSNIPKTESCSVPTKELDLCNRPLPIPEVNKEEQSCYGPRL